MTFDPSKLAFVDTETTGLDPQVHPIWEIAHRPDTAWDLESSVNKLEALTKGRHLVGAVPSFDEERLRLMWRDVHAGKWPTPAPRPPWHYHIIDVEAMAVGWLAGRASVLSDPFGGAPLPWKSDDLSRLIGVEPPSDEERHSALGDARWAKRMFEAMSA